MVNLIVTSAFANSTDIKMDSKSIELDGAKAMVYIITFLFKARGTPRMWHSGSRICPQALEPPVFHTSGWQEDASISIRNSIFSVHAWVSANHRLLIPCLRYIYSREFSKEEETSYVWQ